MSDTIINIIGGGICVATGAYVFIYPNKTRQFIQFRQRFKFARESPKNSPVAVMIWLIGIVSILTGSVVLIYTISKLMP